MQVGWKVLQRAQLHVLLASQQGWASSADREHLQLCTVRATPHKPPERAPEGLSTGPIAELPEERQGEASGVCALLQIKLETLSLIFCN